MKNNKSRFKTAQKHVKQIMKTEVLLKITRGIDLIEENNEALEEDEELNKVIFRKMTKKDLKKSALIHKEVFTRQNYSIKWMNCNFKAFPKIMTFVAVKESQIIGYIFWSQKSGFRNEVVLELEQIAILPEYQEQGIGHKFVIDSLTLVRKNLEKTGALLKHILVTTRADNYAQKLYRKALGAEVEATLKNLYSADEVIMIARNV